MPVPPNTLFVLLGPTAVGKTDVSLALAKHLECSIISADSRQMFRDIPIGTAAPTAEEQSRVEHHFVGQLSLDDYYSASVYEEQALECIDSIFSRQHAEHPGCVGRALLSGGSMMYIDAVCQGIDHMPDIRPEVRAAVKADYAAYGLDHLVAELQRLDPEYAGRCDLHNHVRVIHALEICRQTGTTYTSFRQRDTQACSADDAAGAPKRTFRIVKIGLDRPREELFDRINQRVSNMVEQGFVEEARRVLPWREANSLNTVGFKEMFRCLDGEWPLDFTLDRIRKNTRVYAKKQLTWFRRDPSIHWFHPDELQSILQFVDSYCTPTVTP